MFANQGAPIRNLGGYYDVPICNQYSNKESRNPPIETNSYKLNRDIAVSINNNRTTYEVYQDPTVPSPSLMLETDKPMSPYYYRDPLSLSLDGEMPLVKKKEQSKVYNYINSDLNPPFGSPNQLNNPNVEHFRGGGGGGHGGGGGGMRGGGGMGMGGGMRGGMGMGGGMRGGGGHGPHHGPHHGGGHGGGYRRAGPIYLGGYGGGGYGGGWGNDVYYNDVPAFYYPYNEDYPAQYVTVPNNYVTETPEINNPYIQQIEDAPKKMANNDTVTDENKDDFDKNKEDFESIIIESSKPYVKDICNLKKSKIIKKYKKYNNILIGVVVALLIIIALFIFRHQKMI